MSSAPPPFPSSGSPDRGSAARQAQLRWARARADALEADLGELRRSGFLAPHRPVPATTVERLRHLPASTWWLVAAAALVLAAILVAAI